MTLKDMQECTLKVIAMPGDANPDGNVFGGWIISQMDLAGALPARRVSRHRVVTVAIDNIIFHKPVFIGDCVECHTTVEKIGRSSITVSVEVIVERRDNYMKEKVTQGRFVYVALGPDWKSIEIQQPVTTD